jgi:hypothetical protein
MRLLVNSERAGSTEKIGSHPQFGTIPLAVAINSPDDFAGRHLERLLDFLCDEIFEKVNVKISSTECKDLSS